MAAREVATAEEATAVVTGVEVMAAEVRVVAMEGRRGRWAGRRRRRRLGRGQR